MDCISKCLFGNDDNIEKRNIIWNIIGSFIYSLTSTLLGSVVIHLTDKSIGGIFFFAFSTLGEQIYTISYFGTRPIHITDVESRFNFEDYRNLRILTSSCAILLGLIYTFYIQRSKEEVIIYSLLLIYKAIDGFVDCYESEFQRRGRLYMAGKSISLRTLLSLFCFIISLYFYRDIFTSSFIFVFVLCISSYFLAIRPLKYFDIIRKGFSKERLIKLASTSAWLFISTFLALYIFSSSKYAVNKIYGGEYNSYFSAVFIPTSLINLMSGFVIRPVLTRLSLAYEQHEFDKFKSDIMKIFLIIIGFGIISLIGAYIFGELFIKIVVGGDDLRKYIPLLLIIMLGGLFYAVSNLFYYCLVIMKRQRDIFLIYLIFSLVAYLSSGFATMNYGLSGAGVIYMLNMFFIMLSFAICSMINLRKE